MLFCNRNIVTFIILLQSVDLVTTHFFLFLLQDFQFWKCFSWFFFVFSGKSGKSKREKKKLKLNIFGARVSISHIFECVSSRDYAGSKQENQQIVVTEKFTSSNWLWGFHFFEYRAVTCAFCVSFFLSYGNKKGVIRGSQQFLAVKEKRKFYFKK